MRRFAMTTLGVLTVSAALTASCAGEKAPPVDPNAPLEIVLTTDPDPMRTGEASFTARLTRGGAAVTDATVTAVIVMEAMPAMNMPEMRTKAELAHQGDGVYRGPGQVMMAGEWDVTVTATRAGQTIGARTVRMTVK